MAENTKADGAKALLDVAFRHPIKIIANALGVPPDWMVQMGKIITLRSLHFLAPLNMQLIK